MSRWICATIVAVLTFAAVPVHAGGWSIGSNLGISVLHPKGGEDNLLALGVPGSAGQLVPGFQPGLRLGFGASGNEGFFDVGLNTLAVSGETISAFQVSANYQHDFSATGSSSYFTVGAGILGQSYESQTHSNLIVGGGLGVRNRVADGHGALRAEMRLDYITEDTRGFVGGLLFGIKFGFDLWMR